MDSPSPQALQRTILMKICIRSFVFFCACLAFFNPAFAADGVPATPPEPNVNIRAGVHPEFDRLVVDWPKSVAYAVHRDDTRVTVEFAASAHAVWPRDDLGHLKRSRSFLAATGKDGHLIISFNINPKAAIKDFTSGTSVVIDITDKQIAEKPVAKKAAEKPAAKEPEKKEAENPRAPPPVAQTVTPPAAAAATPAPPEPTPAPAPAPEVAKPVPTPEPIAAAPPLSPAPAPVAAVAPAAVPPRRKRPQHQLHPPLRQRKTSKPNPCPKRHPMHFHRYKRLQRLCRR